MAMRNLFYYGSWILGIAFLSKVIYDLIAGRVSTGFDKIGTLVMLIGALGLVVGGFLEFKRRHGFAKR
jgi:hypothetical protein